jgi:hypothetical protein
VKDVPRLRDIVKGDVNSKMLRLLEVGFDIGQAFYLPPGTPGGRVDALRTAFARMLKDPEMLAEAAKRKLPTITRNWQDTARVADEAFKVEPAVASKLAQILGLSEKKKK